MTMTNGEVPRRENTHYVCVTGFNAIEELSAIQAPSIPGLDVFLGILVSSKSFKNEQSSPRHATKDQFMSMVAARNPLNETRLVAHFNVNKGFESSAPEEAKELASAAGAIQLNIANPILLEQVAMAVCKTDATVIFQLNSSMSLALREGALVFFRDIWNNATQDQPLERRMRTKHLLYDMSGGGGKKIDVAIADRFVRSCRIFGDFSPAVAGGLTPEDPHLGLDLGASIDIETQVRDQDNKLDVARANLFLANARNAMIAMIRPRTR